MKIYFAASVTGGRDYEKYYRQIVKILESLGHRIISQHVVSMKLQNEVRRLANRSKDSEKYISEHNKKLMKRADMIVAECSQGSLGTGFEICYGAYVLKIPVICFRYKKAKGKTSSTIFGDSSKLIESFFYDENDLVEVMKNATGRR